MVTSIARQSVILKCNMQKSVLLGNYEFYYVSADADMEPEALSEYLLSVVDTLSPKDEKEAYLIKMVKGYEPLPEHDEQMKELFRWGASEPDLLKVTTSYHPCKRIPENKKMIPN